MANYKLTKRAAQRIVSGIKKGERKAASLLGQNKSGRGSPYSGFFARITEVGDDGTYSWCKVVPRYDYTFANNTQWGTGDRANTSGFAVEVNESKYVILNSIVWLEPAHSQDYYVFQYSPGVMEARTTEAIEAATESTRGSGTATIYTAPEGTITDSGIDVIVYNTMSSEVAADTKIQITYNQYEAVWIITAEDCE